MEAPKKPWESETDNASAPKLWETDGQAPLAAPPERPPPIAMEQSFNNPLNSYSNSYGTGYGNNFGNPYGVSSYGNPYGSAYGNPYSSSYGAGSYGNSFGFNRPFGMNNASLSSRMEQDTLMTFQTIQQVVQVLFFEIYD